MPFKSWDRPWYHDTYLFCPARHSVWFGFRFVVNLPNEVVANAQQKIHANAAGRMPWRVGGWQLSQATAQEVSWPSADLREVELGGSPSGEGGCGGAHHQVHTRVDAPATNPAWCSATRKGRVGEETGGQWRQRERRGVWFCVCGRGSVQGEGELRVRGHIGKRENHA